jgi:hypothetical protein
MGTEDDLTSQNEEEMLMRRAIVLTIGVILALMVAAPLASATQAAQDGTLQARVGKLGATWWQWAGSDPTATNSVVGSYSYKTEVGAIKCDGSNPRAAWFLAGTADGSAVTRDCRAPADTRIFFPVTTFVCGPAWSDPFNTEEELRAECNGLVDAALEGATPYATVDGKQVRMVRADTPAFEATVPADNPFGVVGGTSISVADGLWVVLPRGLSNGRHTVRFGGTFTNPFDPGSTFSQDNTYNLKVR